MKILLFSHKTKLNIESTELTENAAKEKDNIIKALEIEMKIQEKKIEDINEKIIILIENEKSSLESRLNTLEERVDENLKEFGNKISMDETASKNSNDDKIKKMERRLYILEKRRLGSDFCEHCDEEFNLGSEKDRKEKEIHIRDNHTFECNVCEMSLENKDVLRVHLLRCEMYTCSLCTYKHKRLSELKNHCKTKHSKMDKENFSKLSFSNHFSEEM